MDRYQQKINYGLIGNGVLANHLSYYFDIENISHTRWFRSNKNEPISDILQNCNIILLAISDDSLQDFIDNNSFLQSKIIVHFSGSLTINNTYGFHPLMTFSLKKYTKDQYRNIPFVGDSPKENFINIFPSLNNKYYEISCNLKPLYHSLCVTSGNFTTMLWQKVFSEFNKELNLPKEVLFPYFDQIVENLKVDYENALTGPIKRQDVGTIKKNIEALKDPLWKKLYKLFNKIYKGRTYEYK